MEPILLKNAPVSTMSLFRRPGKTVFVDDDATYLNMLAMLVSERWSVRLFARPETAAVAIGHEVSLWERDTWELRRIVSQALADPFGVIPAILDYWKNNPQRFGLIKAVVTDFSMPSMDGLQLLSKVRPWPGARVLLTGQADEHIAVQAFNAGLIDLYTPKQGKDLRKDVLQPIEHLVDAPAPQMEQIWQPLLTPVQYTLLREPQIAEALDAFSREHFAEHVVLGNPFGVLGLSAAGVPGWLQLEMPDSFEMVGDLAADAGASQSIVHDVRAGRSVPALETGVRAPIEKLVAPAIDFAGGRLKGALFHLWPDTKLPAQDAWLVSRPKRAVER